MRPNLEPVPIRPQSEAPTGLPADGFVQLDGRTHYRIGAFQKMVPFLVSLPSDTDLWMFITSGGGLTAGRRDPDGALFPYRTVDELHEGHHHTGPVSLLRVTAADGSTVLWEPFAPAQGENPGLERNLYKNIVGNRLVFEEINHPLGLAFRYAWSACDEFGWVRTCTLENRTQAPVPIMVLDGLRNVLPFGAPLHLYQQAGNLVDAYKKTEVDPDTGLGIFSLTAGITDRAEAVEVLRANTVWCCGLEGFRVHLSLDAVEHFRHGRVVPEESVLNGARGNYLVTGHLLLTAGADARWHLACDAGRDHLQIARMRERLLAGGDAGGGPLERDLAAGLDRATDNLRRNVASADGLQLTGSDEAWSHHFANVLFNNLRGGVFAANHDVPTADLEAFLAVRSTAVARRQADLLAALPRTLTIADLHARAQATGDADFRRLCLEYLPLHFGRRHGDPSRPWNRFEIRVREQDGGRALRYEGNWRDIFQNWEALATAFPGFLPNFVAKFVNASTVDGFNPYRLDRDGVDWETVDPQDPWSNIGYWGDHQIIYLLKLLEAWDNHETAALAGLLGAAIFSYADVPYRLKPYAEILRDPSATITFDQERAGRIATRVAALGTDGKLVAGADGAVHHANLLEKLLVPALAKLSNLIPDAGIWMNTQRPEWNDANNALAGGGASVVTLCHLRRYLDFLAHRLAPVATDTATLPVAREVVAWLAGVERALAANRHLLQGTGLSPEARKELLDGLGGAFGDYRRAVYDHGFSGVDDLPLDRVVGLCRTALEYLDFGLEANRRADGLFHTYNVANLTADGRGLEVTRLPVMLEGQVAALTAGVLAPEESLDILERLFASALYRPRENSFMLYPEGRLPGFLEKNRVPRGQAAAIDLLQTLLARGDRSLLAPDAQGTLRFAGDFRHAGDLDAALDRLAAQPDLTAAVARDRAAILELFETVFHHRSYTGRSGAMYAYEGLGCVYWHMVAKLLLAVQETCQRAAFGQAAGAVGEGLARMYYRVREGIGYQKSARAYGAFPTDPYSHTPASGGARQPGMTGQVKEEILTRRGELGVTIGGGRVRFRPALLEPGEFLADGGHFACYDTLGRDQVLDLPPGSLAFTLCQVPVVYELAGPEAWIRVEFSDGTGLNLAGDELDEELSRQVFAREGRLAGIRVGVLFR